jgi:broad specificity phosphatase PhoE
LLVALAAAGLSPPAVATASADGAWQALAMGGHVVLLRHASAPGLGDPPGFRLDDCTSQRNLSAAGRGEAMRIGETLRRHSVRVDAVYSSEWCRCVETARLLGAGPVTPFPPLNSFFQRPEAEAAQMAELRAWLAALKPAGTVVLVTHQVVITALTGLYPASGEIIVVRPGAGPDPAVVGRIPPPG